MSNDSFISCIYKRLYWVIEFEINHKGSERDQLGDNTVAQVILRVRITKASQMLTLKILC